MRFERLLNVVVQIGVRDFRDIVDAEEFFRLPRARIGEFHRLVLAVDDIIPILGRGERFLAFGGRGSRCGSALFLLLRLVIRLLGKGHFRDVYCFFLVLFFLDGFYVRFLLFVFPFLSPALEFRVLFLFQLVVEAARKRAHEPVHLHVKIGGFFALARNDQRRSRFVDQDGVHFVDDGIGQISLHHLFEVGL